MRYVAVAALVVAGFIAGAAFVYLIPIDQRAAGKPAGHATQSETRPGAVDVGFCQDMSVHHQQAVLMSSMALSRARPTVRALAASILAAQAQELGVMRGWLTIWHRPQVNPAPMAWMASNGANPAMSHMTPGSEHHNAEQATAHRTMMGMASPQEMNDLWQRSGKEFDILYLQLMLRHHQGGVMMAKDAAQVAKLEFVRGAARRMVIEQQKESAIMKSMLEADGAAALPFP